jgi:hypothetical protein
LNGFSQRLLFTPILPEIIDSVYHKHSLIEGENEVFDGFIGDKAAGLLFFFSLAVITTPLMGSAVYSFF